MIDPGVLIALVSGGVTLLLAIITGVGIPLLNYKLNQATLDRAATAAAIAATKMEIAETKAIAVKTQILAEKTELHTNSMKDALVRVTAEAAHSAGKEEARLEGEVKAAAVAEGAKVAMGMTLSDPRNGSHVVGEAPLPVADDRTAVAGERVAVATERVADAAEEKKV